jgi:LacI family transcriptional regulator
MSPKIVNIAKAAKVSPATVSLALKNKTGVSNEVRQKIMHIAADMGYKTGAEKSYPVNENTAIRFLKIAKHGHVVNDRHTDFITEYLEGIESEVKRRKYKFELSFFNQIPVEEIVASQKESSIDGFIVLGTELCAHELTSFTEIPKPIVFIDTYFPLSAYDCIDMDNVDGVFKAIQHLYINGHRSIGLIKSSRETRNFKMREYGFREAMEYFSLPVQDNFMLSIDPAFEQAVVDMKGHLKKIKTLPTAFFCMNDIIAYACIKALREFNFNIPADISIIGFDDLPLSNFSDPPLTSIRVSTHQIGQRALEKLSERIISPSAKMPENILVAGNLICRNSVRKL